MTNQASRGFTLVEMLVVLALVALMMAISLPYASQSRGARSLDAAAQIIASYLRNTQSAAIGSNRERQLLVDLKNGMISGPDDNRSYELPDKIGVELFTVDNQIKEDRATFRFFPDGGSTGGKIVLSSGTNRREIAINWLTGAVVVSSGEQQ